MIFIKNFKIILESIFLNINKPFYLCLKITILGVLVRVPILKTEKVHAWVSTTL